MKIVEAIVDNAKLNDVRASLARAGVDEMTVSEVRGYQQQSGPSPKVKIEIAVEDGRVPALLQELLRATRTGRAGDGKIFVLPVDDAVRIRTNERGRDAL